LSLTMLSCFAGVSRSRVDVWHCHCVAEGCRPNGWCRCQCQTCVVASHAAVNCLLSRVVCLRGGIKHGTIWWPAVWWVSAEHWAV